MRVGRYVALAALLFMVPIRAEAAGSARGWFAWLEELSGPGYFGGPMVSFAVTCWNAGGQRTACYGGPLSIEDERAKGVKKSVRVSGGFLTSRNRLRFDEVFPSFGTSENADPVQVVPLFATYTVQTGRAFEIGTGGGVIGFFGTGVNVRARPILTPVTVSWKFLLGKASARSWRNYVALEGQTFYIFPGFDGTSFASSDNGFHSPPELKGSIGVSVSFGAR